MEPVAPAANANHLPLTEAQHARLNCFLTASCGAGAQVARDVSVAQLVAHDAIHQPLLTALDVPPAALLHAGATLAEMCALGYTAEAVASSPSLAAAMVKSFGKTQVAVALLTDAPAAQHLSGTFACAQLGISARMLLNSCAGCRTSALVVVERVLHTATQPAPLAGCTDTLARCGVDARVLCERFHIAPTALPAVLGCQPSDLGVLGLFVEPPPPPVPPSLPPAVTAGPLGAPLLGAHQAVAAPQPLTLRPFAPFKLGPPQRPQ